MPATHLPPPLPASHHSIPTQIIAANKRSQKSLGEKKFLAENTQTTAEF